MILEYPKLPSSLLKLKRSTAINIHDTNDDKKSEISTISSSLQQKPTTPDRNTSLKVDNNSLSPTSSLATVDDNEVDIVRFWNVI